MKLEVGKKYVVRDPEATTIKFVEVKAIIPEMPENDQVVFVRCYEGGYRSIMTCGLNGRLWERDESPTDIVAEYKEPELNITEADVGKRVRLRSGWITMIIAFDPEQDSEYKVKTSTDWVQGTGHARPDKQESPYDIVEILD